MTLTCHVISQRCAMLPVYTCLPGVQNCSVRREVFAASILHASFPTPLRQRLMATNFIFTNVLPHWRLGFALLQTYMVPHSEILQYCPTDEQHESLAPVRSQDRCLAKEGQVIT